jgi:hypothetical protein
LEAKVIHSDGPCRSFVDIDDGHLNPYLHKDGGYYIKRKGYGTMDANVTMSNGTAKRLSEFCAGGRVVLVFLRHFG